MRIINRQVKIFIFSTVISCFLGVSGLNFRDLVDWFGFDDSRLFGHILFDGSNDDAAFLNTHQLIERAGFGYENYYALSDDGYITQLIRIINPLADSNYLKVAPILIQHGQTSNSRNFVMQSNKQHRPMPYPMPKDSQIDQNSWSSNRSLALMLANNGYDVWLTSMRGVDEYNQGFIEHEAEQNIKAKKDRILMKNLTRGEERLLIERVRSSYWSFTLDDVIAHELPSQIATVLNVTGAPKVSLFGFSNSALTTFAMLSIRPDIAAYVDTYIAAAPVVYYNRLNGWFRWFMEEFMQLMPQWVDADLLLSDSVSEFLRRVIARACAPLTVRYTVCKFAVDLFFGESSQFRTFMELPFFGHLFHPTSFKCLAQHLQIVKSHRLAKFDYGRKLNKLYYGRYAPPLYDLSDINPDVNIALVSGEHDCWANQGTLDQVRRDLPRKPILDLVLQDYNHLDLGAAVDVDQKVNLPILELLEQRQKALTLDRNELDSGEDSNWYSAWSDEDYFMPKEVDKSPKRNSPFSFFIPQKFRPPQFRLPDLPFLSNLPNPFQSIPSRVQFFSQKDDKFGREEETELNSLNPLKWNMSSMLNLG